MKQSKIKERKKERKKETTTKYRILNLKKITWLCTASPLLVW